MRMRVQRWWRLSFALFLFAAAGTAASAQEPPAPTPPPPETPAAPPPEAPSEDTPAPAPATEAAELDDRLGHWHLDLEQWIAQPSGLVCQSTLERREGEALHRDTIAFESVRVRAVGELAMRPVIGGPAR